MRVAERRQEFLEILFRHVAAGKYFLNRKNVILKVTGVGVNEV